MTTEGSNYFEEDHLRNNSDAESGNESKPSPEKQEEDISLVSKDHVVDRSIAMTRKDGMRRPGYECPICGKFHYSKTILEQCLRNSSADGQSTRKRVRKSSRTPVSVDRFQPNNKEQNSKRKRSYDDEGRQHRERKRRSSQNDGNHNTDPILNTMASSSKKGLVRERSPKNSSISSSSSSGSTTKVNNSSTSWKDWNANKARLDRKLKHFPVTVSHSSNALSRKCILCKTKCKLMCLCCKIFLHPAKFGNQENQSCWEVFHTVEDFTSLPNVVYVPTA